MWKLIIELRQRAIHKWRCHWWRANADLARALSDTEFKTFTDFASRYPHASLRELTCILSVSPTLEDALAIHLIEEAESRQDVERLVRDLAVRFIYADPPPEFDRALFCIGWGLGLALYRIAMFLPLRYRAACLRVALGFQNTQIPKRWKPLDARDPILLDLTTSYWPETSVKFFPVAKHTRTARVSINALSKISLSHRSGRDDDDDTEQDETSPPAA